MKLLLSPFSKEICLRQDRSVPAATLLLILLNGNLPSATSHGKKNTDLFFAACSLNRLLERENIFGLLHISKFQCKAILASGVG